MHKEISCLVAEGSLREAVDALRAHARHPEATTYVEDVEVLARSSGRCTDPVLRNQILMFAITFLLQFADRGHLTSVFQFLDLLAEAGGESVCRFKVAVRLQLEGIATCIADEINGQVMSS
jgi:hypothetical protein